MSPLKGTQGALAALELVEHQLNSAAQHYKAAFQAQRFGTECWCRALAEIAVEYKEDSPTEVGKALRAFNEAVKESDLLSIEVGDPEVVRSMEQATLALSKVAEAARAVAQALRKEALQ